jgi:hypothetical protein
VADDLSAYIGYRSAGRRRPELNDRRAAADVPVALARGAVSGVLGAPGDIESLIRMLPGLSEQTVLPTSEDVEKRLPMRSVSETPAGRAFTTAGQLGGGFYTGPGSPLRAIAGLPSAVSRAARDFALAAGQSGAHVVKPKGGNWLAGSVERAIEPMRLNELPARQFEEMRNIVNNPDMFSADKVQGTKYFLDMHNQNSALNRWLETKLAKYMRNEMGTPEDPLRALAEQGVTHSEVAPLNTYLGDTMALRRESAGFPAKGFGQSEEAKRWEAAADYALHNLPAKNRLTTQGIEAENPWLLKVPPETMTYGAYSDSGGALGFPHLVDELRNAVNPNSGLPAHLSWKYSDLDKVTVPQAVERVAKINEWRAAQKAEADMARAMNPATQVVKEYPDQGYKWVELKNQEMPSGWSAPDRYEIRRPTPSSETLAIFDKESGKYITTGLKSEEQAVKHLHKTINNQALEDALKYEGETMGHCVGGYCPDVSEGRSRIYSLRDENGQPHVTIEVKPGKNAEGLLRESELPPDVYEDLKRRNILDPNFRWRFDPDRNYYVPELGPFEPEIVQIKGSGKKDPGQRLRVKSAGYKDEPDAHLLPFVQDFVRSGNWGRVSDLGNTNLVDLGEEGLRTTGQRFLTNEEFLKMQSQNPGDFSLGGLVNKYAEGGVVMNQSNMNQANMYNSDAKQDPTSAYKFSDGGFAGNVPAYALGGLVQKYADGGPVARAPKNSKDLLDLLRSESIGSDPQIARGVDVAEARLANAPGVTPEVIESMVHELERVVQNPSSYPEVRAKAIEEGYAQPGDLPEQYDPQIVMSLLVLLYKLLDRMQGQKYAKGGAVNAVAAAGRGGDTMLAHLSPESVRLLTNMGGGGTVNPTTGLTEFKGGAGRLIKAIAPIALSIVAPGVGTAIGAALGASGAAASALGGAVIGGLSSAASGGNALKGALGGAIGGGLGTAVGGAANEAMNLGLGSTGSQVLGGALTGAAQGAVSGAGVLPGAIGGALGGYGTSLGGLTGAALQGMGGSTSSGGDALQGALGGISGFGGSQLGGIASESLGLTGGAANAVKGAVGAAVPAAMMGGNVARSALTGGIQGSNIGKTLLSSLASKYDIPNLQQQASMAFGPSKTEVEEEGGILAAPFGSQKGATGPAPYSGIPGTFSVASPDQVGRFANAAPEGSMRARYENLPVFETIGKDNYVQRFINAAESGYMNPAWATYRPDVQIMASNQPPINMGEDKANAYVPNRYYPGTKDTVMLVNSGDFTPAQAAQTLGHELYHVKQPGKDAYPGSPGFMREFNQNIGSTIPYLQEKYGYQGAYDARANTPLSERMADLQSFQFNQNIDLAKDPVFQQKVLNDPLAAAMWNASTVERTTRLDPRDLPPGKLTSSDFPKGQVPLTYQAQDAYRRFMNPGRTVNYAAGGLVSGANFPTDDFDPARIDSIVDQLHAMNAG